MPDPPAAPELEVRRAGDRTTTRVDGITSRHSFSFGGHYDPANTSFGVLLVHNEDVLQPGAGYDDHPHRAVEIVTWVLGGRLTHRDHSGGRAVVGAGTVQRLSAGSGVAHSERNASRSEPVHFVQMWVTADPPDGEPDHAQADITTGLTAGGLILVASARTERAPAVTIRQPGAELFGGRLPAGGSVELPTVPYLHLFVARGDLTLRLGPRAVDLATGDAARLVRPANVPAGPAGPLVEAGTAGAEVLVWAMARTLHPS